jgi:hypothetical protein
MLNVEARNAQGLSNRFGSLLTLTNREQQARLQLTLQSSEICRAWRLQQRYDERMENAIIELTEQQWQALSGAESEPLRLVDPRTKQSYVLLRADEYEHLKQQEYDDSPWTREELEVLAWEAGEQSAWDEYDDAAEKP